MSGQNTLRGLLATGKAKAQDSPMLRTLLDVPRVAREQVGMPLSGLLSDMSMMDKAALATSPVPVVGDIVGLAADAKSLYDNPSWKNAGLMGLGALPWFPSLAVTRGLQAAVMSKKTGDVVSGAPIHIINRMTANKKGYADEDLVDGFIAPDGAFLDRNQAFDFLSKNYDMTPYKNIDPDMPANQLETFAQHDFFEAIKKAKN